VHYPETVPGNPARQTLLAINALTVLHQLRLAATRTPHGIMPAGNGQHPLDKKARGDRRGAAQRVPVGGFL
jgi:hypothetical protein